MVKMNIPSPIKRTWYGEFLPKMSNYIVGITLLCYISGFVITNLFLGSLGVMNIDLLRARYIQAGLLFLFFFGAIAYLTYGLILTLKKYYQKSAFHIIYQVIRYSFDNIIILFYAVLALAFLAGSKRNLPIGLPYLSPIVPWSEWLGTVPASLLQPTSLFLGVGISIVVVIVAIVVIINPKDKSGIKTPRKQVITDMLKRVWQKKLKIIITLLGYLAFIYLSLLMSNLLTFIASNKVETRSESSALLGSGDWLRFLGAIILIYGLITVILTVFIIGPSSSERSGDEIPLRKTSLIIFIIALGITFIVPTYALGVYPNIPQQIGGGQIIRVEINISSDEVRETFSNSGIEIYMIDRTSTSSLFLVINPSNQKHQVIEITNKQIQSILYNPDP